MWQKPIFNKRRHSVINVDFEQKIKARTMTVMSFRLSFCAAMLAFGACHAVSQDQTLQRNQRLWRRQRSGSKTSLAYYTVFTGTDDNAAGIVYEPPSSKFDCFFFTDNKNAYLRARRLGWRAVSLGGPPMADEIGSCMKSKMLRTRPHLYRELTGYRYLIMIDSKIIGDVHDENTLQIISSMPEGKAVIHRRHYNFSQPGFSVWTEFEFSMPQQRYRLQADQMRHYIHNMVKAGYDDTTHAHLMGGYIVRDMSNPITSKIGDAWYQNILSCGIQDQVSLFFVHQMFRDFYHVIPPYPI